MVVGLPRCAEVSRASRILELVVGIEEEGERLDAYLARHTDLSRTRAQRLIERGQVSLDGSPAARKSEPVWPGLKVQVKVPPPETVTIVPEDLPLEIVYQDEALVVVNKPAGMVVHPAPGHPGGTLVNALLYHVRDLSGVGGRLRPGIVHRLDRDTSGLLVAAKRDDAHHALTESLRRRHLRRVYLAACWGHLGESPITVDAPLARDPRHRQRIAVVPTGKRAVTRVKVHERWLLADLLDVALQTGRTHQIRVHLAHLGHPVVGDSVYGPARERGMGGSSHGWVLELSRRVTRQFLHATELVFDHPLTGQSMRFHAPLPADLEAVVTWARLSAPLHPPGAGLLE